MHLYTTFFISMLAITNPIGNLAIFISLIQEKSLAEQKKAAITCALAIFIILVIVVWTGHIILEAFGISTSAFQVAGGLVIILLGLSMLNGHNADSGKKHSSMHYSNSEHDEAKSSDSVAIVPMAIPLIAGPGAITTIIIHTQALSAGHIIVDKLFMTGIVIFLSLIIGGCFYFASWFNRVLSASTIQITTRIMGLVLMAIAFDMLGSGLLHMFPGWA